MKHAWIGLVLTLALAAGPLIRRDALKSLETGLTEAFRTHDIEIFAFPSGLYVDGVGVVFTSDISLTYAPMANPFMQVFPPEYKAKIHDKELKQVPVLREQMRQFLLKTSVTLDTLPAAEQIIVGVKISHQLWEDKSGIPEQIVMQGVKSKLMEAKLGKAPVEDVILVREQ